MNEGVIKSNLEEISRLFNTDSSLKNILICVNEDKPFRTCYNSSGVPVILFDESNSKFRYTLGVYFKPARPEIFLEIRNAENQIVLHRYEKFDEIVKEMPENIRTSLSTAFNSQELQDFVYKRLKKYQF